MVVFLLAVIAATLLFGAAAVLGFSKRLLRVAVAVLSLVFLLVFIAVGILIARWATNWLFGTIPALWRSNIGAADLWWFIFATVSFWLFVVTFGAPFLVDMALMLMMRGQPSGEDAERNPARQRPVRLPGPGGVE